MFAVLQRPSSCQRKSQPSGRDIRTQKAAATAEEHTTISVRHNSTMFVVSAHKQATSAVRLGERERGGEKERCVFARGIASS